MKPIEKILFPVDLSESADRIVECVLEFVKRFEPELHLLFVARAFGYFSTIYVDSTMITGMEKAIVEGAKQGLMEFKERYFKDVSNVNVIAVVSEGYASTEIIEYIKKHEIDLIIMGTHGRSGLGKVMFGSVADRVLRTSPVPVTVVNPYYQNKT